ncbi:efflux RND transporter periplasmic adaptor subunit [Sulfuriferula multivorans]|uniref:efflux RND transporter periplasmic adaptor subunit n=1 Tax=Sulfuriferula multivorans TaxID=1559896 RepID=UPI000F5C255C|nr:efflux RND transporter periplasmic adaptor subunit [Sulfuriferula multivorans]
MNTPTQSPSSSQLPATQPHRRRFRGVLIVAVLAIIVGLLVWGAKHNSSAPHGAADKKRGAGGPTPVTAATARVQPVPVWLNALGTVTPRSYVNVMPRVTGLLQSVHYREGQMVKAGQLLAQIDPRSFQIAVEQAQGVVMRDQAQLDGARLDLVRYQTLQAQDSIAHQQVDDQKALVGQYTATLATDRAALDNARLQLGYTSIVAPVSGLAGLRPVDAGNMVNTSGAIGVSAQTASGTATSGNTAPIVTLAQVQPVTVTFAIPQQQIGPVLQHLYTGKAPLVEAWDARNSQQLATGKLLAADNQISTTTGTLNLKAEFANQQLTLYPNQFVNVRLRVATLDNAVVVPSSAVAVGAPGTFVYVIGSDNKVTVRKITPGVSDAGLTVITSGLQAGEKVVTDGLDRLRAGAAVRIVTAQTGSNAGQGKGKHGAGQRGAGQGKAP